MYKKEIEFDDSSVEIKPNKSSDKDNKKQQEIVKHAIELYSKKNGINLAKYSYAYLINPSDTQWESNLIKEHKTMEGYGSVRANDFNYWAFVENSVYQELHNAHYFDHGVPTTKLLTIETGNDFNDLDLDKILQDDGFKNRFALVESHIRDAHYAQINSQEKKKSWKFRNNKENPAIGAKELVIQKEISAKKEEIKNKFKAVIFDKINQKINVPVMLLFRVIISDQKESIVDILNEGDAVLSQNIKEVKEEIFVAEHIKIVEIKEQ